MGQTLTSRDAVGLPDLRKNVSHVAGSREVSNAKATSTANGVVSNTVELSKISLSLTLDAARSVVTGSRVGVGASPVLRVRLPVDELRHIASDRRDRYWEIKAKIP